MRHGAVLVGVERFSETLTAFLVIEAVTPVQPVIEPALRHGRCR